MKIRALNIVTTGLPLLLLVPLAQAEEVTITIENLMQKDSFFFTPFWAAVHNGGFDSYDPGTFASMWPGLTELAEEGDTGPIGDAFMMSAAGMAGGVQTTITAVSGMGDAPVFSPGESTSLTLNIGDATINRYFSYASMVVPSNDLFVANSNPTAYELFDAAGNFIGPVVIDIYGSSVNDNGSEVNNALGGAAFSANGGVGVDENELIRSFFTNPGDADYLSSFLGSQTGNGATINTTFQPGELIGRITIVPAPGALAAMSVLGLAFGRRRRPC